MLRLAKRLPPPPKNESEPESSGGDDGKADAKEDGKIMGFDLVIGVVVIAGIVLVAAGVSLFVYRRVIAPKKKQKARVLPVALDPTRSPELEATSRAGKLPPLAHGASPPTGSDPAESSAKIRVMPFVDSAPSSPQPKVTV